ncbi:adaptin N terminal region-domain-containing protein [Dipodascopsis uninucleata]
MASRASKASLFKKSLHDLIRGIRACKDPEATDKYIRDAISECRKEVLAQDMDVKTMAVMKLAYLQMLGYDMAWASFNVLEVMSSSKFSQKRIGYLAAMQSFGADTDVLMLTTNMLKKDLSSANHLDVAIAISGISNIVSPSLARDLSDDLLKMINHSRPYVRKKAVLVMYKIFLQFPEALRSSFPRLREKLEDPEISVVSATVNVICELAKKHPKNYLPLAPQLFNILTTSSNNWMLIKIIKLFSSLAPIEPRLKAKLVPPITNIIQTTTAMSLLYECINCIVAGGMLDKDDEQLATMCVNKLREFFEETDQNLKFVGLLAYNKIVLIHPNLVAQNVDVVMDCMDDPDLSIRQRAVELVVYLINPETIFDVVKRLMLQLIPQSRDQVLPESYRAEVVRRILDMCSNNTYANVTNFEWYIAVLVDLVKISEGIKDVGVEIGLELQNVAVRVRSVRDNAVNAAARMVCDRNILNKNVGVLKYASWIVGEYAIYLDNPDVVLDFMLKLEPHLVSADIEAAYIQSIPKVFAVYAGSSQIPWTQSRVNEVMQLTARIEAFLESYATSMDIEVQERAVEFLEFFRLIELSVTERQGDDTQLEPPLLITQAMSSMFNMWELNPVSTKAQRKIPIPEGLDLDEEFNDPVYVSESEDEDELLLRQQLLKQQAELANKNVNSTSNGKIKKGIKLVTPETSEDEEEKERKKAERRKRQQDDPFYILESEKVVSKSKKISDSASDTDEDDPMRDEELDIDSIPIMELEIASVSTTTKKSKNKKSNRKAPVHIDIVQEETFGGDDDHEDDDIDGRPNMRRTAGSRNGRSSSQKSKAILRVDARGLEGYDIDDAEDDEVGRQEVEKFKQEILEARRRAEQVEEEEAEATHIVVKKKKKAKSSTTVKKTKKLSKKSKDSDIEDPAREPKKATKKSKSTKVKVVKSGQPANETDGEHKEKPTEEENTKAKENTEKVDSEGVVASIQNIE